MLRPDNQNVTSGGVSIDHRTTRTDRGAQRPGAVAAKDLPRRLGITYRQLDYWIRSGWLETTEAAPGRGHHRYVTPAEVTVATVMAAFVNAGVELLAAHRAARDDGWLAPDVRIMFAGAVV